MIHFFLSALQAPAASSALTGLMCGKKDDEGDNYDEKQGNNSNEADLQGGPAGLLSRLWRVGFRHSRVFSFSC